MLDMGIIDEAMQDILLKLLHSNAKTKLSNGTPQLVQADGSEEKETIVIGCIVYDPNASELIWWGDINYGTTSNEAKHYTIL